MVSNAIRNEAANLARTVTRTTAFFRKDIVDFIRQPQLFLTLVLGPFLILLLFGLGLRSQPIYLRTIIVIGEDNPFRPFVEEHADNLVQHLILVDVIESESSARLQLINENVDIVIVVPDDVEEKLRSNEQPVFITYHNTIDPMRRDYIRAFTNVYVGEVNRRTHLIAIQQAQQEAGEVQPQIGAARESAANLRQAMERGNEQVAREELSELRQSLDVIQTGVGPSGWLLLGSGVLLSETGGGQENESQDLLIDSLRNVTALSLTESDELDSEESLERAAQLEEDLAELETDMEEFRNTDPKVIASPFVGENQSVARTETELSDYYVPGTVAMLLQHLCITLGALSFVRERQTGAMELFQASPLAAAEILVGKYVAYWLAGALAGGALTGLLHFILRVPMIGSWWEYAGTLAVLMFTSLGVGFLISIVARSISQAVQYSMISLLASIFFSGFFISLDLMQWFVQLISWIIPASYGSHLLEDIMLRGLSIRPEEILILTVLGIALFIIAWVGLRRELAGA